MSACASLVVAGSCSGAPSEWLESRASAAPPFCERRERGHWFQATPIEVRRASTERSVIELYRPSEAGERAAAREAAEAAKAETASALAAASAAERRRLRRERRRAAAEMLGAGMTQVAAAQALGVSDRTIRNWAKAPLPLHAEVEADATLSTLFPAKSSESEEARLSGRVLEQAAASSSRCSTPIS